MPQHCRPLHPAHLFIASLLLAGLSACASKPTAPVRTVAPGSVDVTAAPAAVEAMVLKALDRQHWRIVRPFDRGVLVAERPHGNGKARIRVRVARGAVHLDYISSDQFDYAVTNGVTVINNRYNGWMDLLRSEIEFGALTLGSG